MYNKLKLLVCYLLIYAIVPINLAFAANPIDRDGDGIHIDDIVYYLSHTGSLSTSDDVRNLLNQIAPITLTAGDMAAGITSVTAPAADVTSLTLPIVPSGFTIAISGSSNTGVVGTNGTIVPPTTAASVNLVFTVTRTSDGNTANTSAIALLIPAHVPITTGGTVTASGENTSGEGKEKAFDGTTDTKWYNPSSTGWIQIQLTAAHIVTQYSVSSANDSPGRDPKDWTFKGSNDGTNWTILDTRAGETFASRFQTKHYTFNNSTSYHYYRLDVSANHGDTALQLSEIGLFGTPAPPPTVVIDLSNDFPNGTSFGSSTNEVNRWQTFTGNGYPNLTSIDVKIHKRIGTNQSDVTVQLFATSNNTPTGSALASTTIPSGSVGTLYSSINVPLTYNGLTNGTIYAIVLGQVTNSGDNNYEWISGKSGTTTGQNFGKFDGASTWTDETSSVGSAWLKVYVN